MSYLHDILKSYTLSSSIVSSLFERTDFCSEYDHGKLNEIICATRCVADRVDNGIRKELPAEFLFLFIPFPLPCFRTCARQRHFYRFSSIFTSFQFASIGKQNSYRRPTVSLFLDVVCFSSSPNAISASTFMSLLPVGRWPRISITFAQIINLLRGITRHNVIHRSSMKSPTFLN